MDDSEVTFLGRMFSALAAAMALGWVLGGHESLGPRVAVGALAVVGAALAGLSKQSFYSLVRFTGRAIGAAFIGIVITIGVVGSIWATGVASLWILTAAVLGG